VAKIDPEASGRKTGIRHNVYFDGTVQSLGFSADGKYATVGVISPGQYRFTTEYRERTAVTSGVLKVRLPGEQWRSLGVGQSFTVPARVAFDLLAEKDVAYLCEFEGARLPTG
jgi:uncharacterized protein YaiE (UPF0345 family)